MYTLTRFLPFIMLVACGNEPAATTPKPTEAPALKAAAPKAPAATVAFTQPAEGATVKSPVHFTFAVNGMTVNPAGELVEHTGHHHLIVDGDPIPKGEVVPKDATHIHYGGGQVEATVELSPGPHSLTMQFANGHHESYGPNLSATLHLTVE